MRLIKLIFWLLIIGLIVFVVLKRNEVVSYLEKITHGENAVVSTNKADIEQSKKTQTSVQNSNSMDDKLLNNQNKYESDKSNKDAKNAGSSVPKMAQPDNQSDNQSDNIDAPKTQRYDNSKPPVSNNQPDTNSAQKSLEQQAQQAAQKGDYSTALKAYGDMLEANPMQADKWGELGDMFHRMGKKKQAAQAYANAVIIFNQQGKTNLSNKVMPYIERYSPDLVEKIRDAR